MSRPVLSITLALLVSFISLAALCAEKLELAGNGSTQYVITLSQSASTVERTAASELSYYLNRITGAEFRIVSPNSTQGKPAIAVGPGAASRIAPLINLSKKELGDDGIVIQTVSSNIILTGAVGSKRGTLYAVYQFLEDNLGVRWFTSTEDYIPNKPTLTAAITDLRYIPALPYRDILYRDMVGGSGTGISPQYSRMKFAARMKVNGHFAGISEDWGGQWNIVGWCHTAYALMPPDKYFASHPEWYSELKGKRVWDGAQLCYTNPEMLKELTRNVLELIRQNPNAGIIDVSQNDWGGNCQCENCKKIDDAEGSACGSVLYGVNKVAEEVEKQYPGYFVEFISYQYSRRPPKNMRPRDNVIVRLCVIERSCTQPIEDKVNKSLHNDLKVWKNSAKHLMLWDYTDMLSCSLRPHPNVQVFRPDFNLYIKNNVMGIFCEGDDWSLPVGDDEIKHYVMAHQLWDPSLKTNDLIDDFVNGYYGKAAPMIRKYVYNQIKAVRNARTSWNANTNTVKGVDCPWITLKNMNESTRLFNEAEKRVASNQTLLNRVRRLRLQMDQQWIAGYGRYRKEADSRKTEFLGPKDPMAAIDELVARSKSFGISGLAWGYDLSIDAYAAQLRKVVAIAVSKSIPASLPAPFEKMDPKKVFDVQEDLFDLFSVDQGHVSLVADSSASNGQAALLNPQFANWAVQFNDPMALGISGKHKVFASIRVDKIKDKGVAFVGGVWNWSKNKSDVDVCVQLDPNDAPQAVDPKLEQGPLKGAEVDVRDGKYHLIDYGTHNIGKEKLSFWFGTTGGVSPENVKGIYVDRVLFVKA